MTETFELSGRKLAYARSEYNSTPICERAVEVPVGLALLGQATSSRPPQAVAPGAPQVRQGRSEAAAIGERAVLEVGAVLPHYRVGWPADGHTVIDLHEEFAGVINADVLTWEPPSGCAPKGPPRAASCGPEAHSRPQPAANGPQPSRSEYDLIISISTLDHLRNEDEFDSALERLKSWLAPAGLLFVTLPYGQPAWVGGGAWIDRFVLGENDADAVWRMDKIDMARHLWAQVHDNLARRKQTCASPQASQRLDRDGGDDMTLAPLAYHGPSLFANSVYFLLWGALGRWWQT